jgi:hypothetical protein
MPNIPEELQSSTALQAIVSQGLNWRSANSPNIEIEKCFYCESGGFHLRMEVHSKEDEEKSRDGLHSCMKCGKGGNLSSLKAKLGISIPGVARKDWSTAGSGAVTEAEPLPDVETCHAALMADEAALEYLTEERGFSLEIIQKQKLGLKEQHYFRETGKVRALVYPYLVGGNCVWAHYRTLPTMPYLENKVLKAFSSPSGWDSTLYNGEILQPGIHDLVMVEGEANCIAALDHGCPSIVGVPGANFKKAAWIETLDKLGLDKIYICYDADKVGQRAAQVLASRIGIERCYKITLPTFDVVTDKGVRKGKDLNEWFSQGGGTAEAFEALKKSATLFDVEGVASSGDSAQELLDDIMGKGSVLPKYTTPWPGLNKYIGFDDGDVIDIIAPGKIGKTTFALNLVEHMVNQYGEDGVIVCLEMTRAKMARKWICHVADIADNICGLDEEDAETLKNEFLTKIPQVQAMAANRPGKLYFCAPTYKTMDDLYTTIRQIIRRYGVSWVVFDNIQLAADSTSSAKGTNRTEHISQISKTLARMAKEFGTKMVRIIQPRGIMKGKTVQAEDADGSSQLSKDCDCTITLHRTPLGEKSVSDYEQQGMVDESSSFGDDLYVGVPLSRYSQGGRTTLYYDGARSTVKNVPDEKVKQLANDKAKKTEHVGHEAQMKKLGIQPKVVAPVDPQDETVEV